MIDTTSNYWVIRAAAEQVGIIAPNTSPNKATLLALVTEYNESLASNPEPLDEVIETVEPLVLTEADKVWAAVASKPVKTTRQIALINLLSEGATKQAICQQFGWKDWSPSKTLVRNHGYAVALRGDKFFAVQP